MQEKLVRNTYMWQQLHPLMENGRWRKYFESLSTLAKFLGRQTIRRDTLEAAGETYHNMRHRPGELPVAWSVRLVNQYYTAAIDDEFQRGNPFYANVQQYVQHIEPPLKTMLIESLKNTKLKWKKKDLRILGITKPKAVHHLLQRISREFERQIEIRDLTHSTPRRVTPQYRSGPQNYLPSRPTGERRTTDSRSQRGRRQRPEHANVTREVSEAAEETSELNAVTQRQTSCGCPGP